MKSIKTGDRTRIVHFRVPERTIAKAERDLKKRPIVAVSSTNQFFRKIVMDYLAGRLMYMRPTDALGDIDALACSMDKTICHRCGQKLNKRREGYWYCAPCDVSLRIENRVKIGIKANGLAAA